ncbi:hypothetical protein [Paenibacillus sp. FSL M7-0896]|uniref:hypothetical protein n=1 Tax=Paenibacillus sp. FSL M7-0896 TaxID=2921610 RepID=UPI0030DD56F7
MEKVQLLSRKPAFGGSWAELNALFPIKFLSVQISRKLDVLNPPMIVLKFQLYEMWPEVQMFTAATTRLWVLIASASFIVSIYTAPAAHA